MPRLDRMTTTSTLFSDSKLEVYYPPTTANFCLRNQMPMGRLQDQADNTPTSGKAKQMAVHQSTADLSMPKEAKTQDQENDATVPNPAGF